MEAKNLIRRTDSKKKEIWDLILKPKSGDRLIETKHYYFKKKCVLDFFFHHIISIFILNFLFYIHSLYSVFFNCLEIYKKKI